MTKLVIFLTLPEDVRVSYGRKLAPKFPGVTIETVGDRASARDAIEDADALLTFGAMLREEVFDKAGRLKWIHALGTGLDNIVDSRKLGADVVVTSTRGIHGAPMSEMAFLLMLALSRNFARSVHSQAAARWDRWPATLLNDKTVGILGVGLIAEALAPRCKAFGMTVVGISRVEREVAGIDRFCRRDELEQVAGEFDYLIVLVPYEPDTDCLVGARVFAAMKPTAYLINIARGGVVDEDALAAALEAGEIAGAGLDTFVEEPLPPDDPFWAMDNVIVTPHLGGFNDVYVDQALPQFETNLRAFLDGRPDRMINRYEGQVGHS